MRLAKLRSLLVSARNSTGFIDFGRKCVLRIVSLRPRATAAVAGNDEIAYGLWLSFRQHGIKVPDDISLVGFDDREEAIPMDPQLSKKWPPRRRQPAPRIGGPSPQGGYRGGIHENAFRTFALAAGGF